MNYAYKFLLLSLFRCIIVANTGEIYIEPGGETNRSIILGLDHKFSCIIDREIQKEITNFRWLDPQNITIDDNYRRINQRIYTTLSYFGHYLYLYINKLAEEDYGQYTCVANYDGEFLQNRIVIDPYRPITFLNVPFQQEARLGDKYKIKCEVISVPPPTIEWTRNGEKLQNGSAYIVEFDGLIIDKVDESHEGEYVCEARAFQLGEMKSENRKFLLEVVDPPKIINTPEIQTFTDSKNATIRCQATGRPSPTIIWLYSNTNEEVWSETETESEPGTIYIDEENVRNSSEYICKAENKAGEDVRKVFLRLRSELDDIISTPPPITFSLSPDDYSNNFSIINLPSSYVNRNEIIEKKIIDEGKKYACHFSSPKFYVSLMRGISIAKDFLIIDLDAGNALFHDVEIMEWTDEEGVHSSKMGCDSSGRAKIEIKSKTKIQICAFLRVTKDTNSSDNLTIQLLPSELMNGSICFVMENILASKQFPVRIDNSSANYDDGLAWKVSSNRIQMKLNIDEPFRNPIQNKLEIFFEAIEAPIKQKIISNLDLQLASENIPFADCSKFIRDDENSKIANSTSVENNLLYVINNVKLETNQEVSLNVGPIIIDGLFSIDGIDLEILHNNPVLMDPFSGQISSSEKTTDFDGMSMRIRQNDLRGELGWSEKSNHTRWVAFTIDFIEFEISKNITYRYQYPSRCTTKTIYGSAEYRRYLSDRTPFGTRFEKEKVDANVHFGDIRITSSKSGLGENKREFVQFALYEYLKIIIARSIRNSLGERIRNEFISFSDCN